ncbi:Conserved_hypothetical protein [Hexamita inflata]|uniref:Uncharacterized protein n=1 Tax=Hexamita inflata TaxID=28002 RepID=A0AA86Q9F5_9EUKA|nr:Conserved hypothetical protein [Hexamita inflata]
MGRPKTISIQEFSAELSSYFRSAHKRELSSDSELHEAFNDVQKINRTRIWESVSVSLNKTKQQVKNFFFNTWADRFVVKDNYKDFIDSEDEPPKQPKKLLKFQDFKVQSQLNILQDDEIIGLLVICFQVSHILIQQQKSRHKYIFNNFTILNDQLFDVNDTIYSQLQNTDEYLQIEIGRLRAEIDSIYKKK